MSGGELYTTQYFSLANCNAGPGKVINKPT